MRERKDVRETIMLSNRRVLIRILTTRLDCYLAASTPLCAKVCDSIFSVLSNTTITDLWDGPYQFSARLKESALSVLQAAGVIDSLPGSKPTTIDSLAVL